MKPSFLAQAFMTRPDVKDWNGRFKLANQAVADIYGSSVEALVGKCDADFNANAEEVAHFLEDDREVMSSMKPKLTTNCRISVMPTTLTPPV